MLRKAGIDRFVVDPSCRTSIRLWAMREGRNVDDSTRIDRFVCPCSRLVLPEVDSLAGYEGGQKMLTIRLDSTGIDRFVCPCSRPVLPEVDSLAGYEGGQKMSTIRLESLELIDSFALVVNPSYREGNKEGR